MGISLSKHTTTEIIGLIVITAFIIWAAIAMGQIDSMLEKAEDYASGSVDEDGNYTENCGVDPKTLQMFQLFLMIALTLATAGFATLLYKGLPDTAKNELFRRPIVQFILSILFTTVCAMSLIQTGNLINKKGTVTQCGADSKSLNFFHTFTIVMLGFSVLGTLFSGYYLFVSKSELVGGDKSEAELAREKLQEAATESKEKKEDAKKERDEQAAEKKIEDAHKAEEKREEKAEAARVRNDKKQQAKEEREAAALKRAQDKQDREDKRTEEEAQLQHNLSMAQQQRQQQRQQQQNIPALPGRAGIGGLAGDTTSPRRPF